MWQEFKLGTQRTDLYPVIRGAITLVTARLLNVPPSALISDEQLRKLKEAKEAELAKQKLFDESGAELSPRVYLDPSNVDDTDVFYDSTNVRGPTVATDTPCRSTLHVWLLGLCRPWRTRVTSRPSRCDLRRRPAPRSPSLQTSS